MEAAFAIKIVIALVGFAVWVFGKFNDSEAPTPIAATPPPLTRRARRVRNAPAPVAPTPAAPVPAPVPAVAPAASQHDASGTQVVRPSRTPSRGRFFGRAALRQAVVAREVLGPPLSLRPPLR